MVRRLSDSVVDFIEFNHVAASPSVIHKDASARHVVDQIVADGASKR